MAIDNQRNYSFDFLKLFYTIIIIIHHSNLLNNVMLRGYIPVEFFFFISGYFIYSTSKRNITFIQFVKRRIQKLYPGYLCAFILLLLALLAVGKLSYNAPYGPLLEVLLLQNIGIPNSGGVNYAMWYLSVLFYGGGIVFLAIRILRTRWFNVVGAIIIALTYGFCFFQVHEIEYWDTVFGIFYIPFWRGVSDLIIGMWLYQLPKPPTKISKYVQLITFISSLVLMFIPGKLDFIEIVLIATLIYSSTTKDVLLERVGEANILCHCYEYQYFAYLNHVLAIYGYSFIYEIIAKHIQIPKIIQVLALLCIVTFIAYSTKKITNYTVRLLSHTKRKK